MSVNSLSTIISLSTSLSHVETLLPLIESAKRSPNLNEVDEFKRRITSDLSATLDEIHAPPSRSSSSEAATPKLLSRPSSSCPPRSMWSAPQRVPTPAAPFQVLSSATQPTITAPCACAWPLPRCGYHVRMQACGTRPRSGTPRSSLTGVGSAWHRSGSCAPTHRPQSALAPCRRPHRPMPRRRPRRRPRCRPPCRRRCMPPSRRSCRRPWKRPH